MKRPEHCTDCPKRQGNSCAIFRRFQPDCPWLRQVERQRDEDERLFLAVDAKVRDRMREAAK